MMEVILSICATWSKGMNPWLNFESKLEEDIDMPYNELASFSQKN